MAEKVVIENASFKSGFKLAAGGFLFGLCVAIPLAVVAAVAARQQQPEVAEAAVDLAEAAVDLSF